VTGNGDKTLKIKIDNSDPIVISDAVGIIRQLLTVADGEHTVTAWLETALNGHSITTNPIKSIAVCNTDNTIISVLDNDITVGQYETATIRWMAVGAGSTVVVEKGVRDDDATTPTFVKISEESVGRTMQTWRYKCRETGNFTLKLVNGNTEETVDLTVNTSTSLMPVSDESLVMDVDPTGHSNSEINRDQFGYIDYSADGENHPFTFSSNFDWINGGFQQDENGVTAFVIRRGTSVEFDRSLFIESDDTALYGKSIFVQFRAVNSVNMTPLSAIRMLTALAFV
jgi:hypothetical protein